MNKEGDALTTAIELMVAALALLDEANEKIAAAHLQHGWGDRHMKTLALAAGLIMILIFSPALAKTRYETYEARDAVVEGQGGSRTTTDGVDFWTTGDPPRRYEIIGIIRDNRGTGAFFGNAVGSSGIAKKVREVGGDAVILMNQNSLVKSVWSQGQTSTSGNQSYSSGVAIPIEERVTTFAVVKYLSESAPATRSPSGDVPRP